MKKLTLEEFGQVSTLALTAFSNHAPHYRIGQALFNATYELYPELADSLRATGADCFYQDSKILSFVNAILE